MKFTTVAVDQPYECEAGSMVCIAQRVYMLRGEVVVLTLVDPEVNLNLFAFM